MVSRDTRTVQRRLGERIHELRRARGWTQDDLAKQAGISQKYLSEIERGEKAPSFETLIALAHGGFAIRLAMLVFEVDEEPSAEVKNVEQLVAGRSAAERARILAAVSMLVETSDRPRRAELRSIAAESRGPRRRP